ncbi:MAG: hypothetical protein KGS48_16720, partial [Bacteroidetes bacterium]|nr:hypothetical protein [Bacteroidota bacterium]
MKFLTPGTYTIGMNLTPKPVCGSDTVTKTITILEPPRAVVTASMSNQNGCAPLTVNFNNQSTGYQLSYNWTITPATGWQYISGDMNSKEPVIQFNTAGNYTIKMKVSNVCDMDMWSTTVTVKVKPSITLPALGPFCQTASLCFNASDTKYDAGFGTISAYSWSFPGASPASSNAALPCNINYSVSAATTFTYTVSATNECGTSTTSGTFEIQVPPALTLPPSQSVCINQSPIQLNALPQNGIWMGPGVNASGLFDPASAGGPGVKTLTYKYGSGVCQASATTQITVLSLPVVEAGPDLTSCINQTSIPLSGNSPANGTWTSSGSGVIVGNNFNPSASGVNTYTLTYQVKDANGCINSDARKITVNALPTVTTTDLSYCNSPGLVPLPTANPVGGSWMGAGVSGSQFDPVAAGLGTHPLTYTYTDPVTGCSNTAVSNVTVSNPTTIFAGNDTTVCLNAGIIHLGMGVSPAGGNWTSSVGGLTGSDFDPNATGSGVFNLKYTFGTGNCMVMDTRVITVLPLPIVNAGTNKSVCVDQTSLMLNPTPAGGSWMGSTAITGNDFNPSQAGAGQFTLTYTYTDIKGCKNSDDLNIQVFSLPSVVAHDTTYCNTPGLVSLPYTNPMGGTWTGPGISNNQFNPIAAGGPNTYTAVYTYTNSNNCSNQDTAKIIVISPTSVDAGPDAAYCESETAVNLGADSTPGGGTWISTGLGLTGDIFNPKTAGPGTYTLTYSVGTGNCEVKDTRIITVYALPIVQAGPDLNACIDAMPIALNATPAGGSWSGSAGLSGNSFAPKQVTANTYKLVYSYTDIHGCINQDDINFTVNPLPEVKSGDTTYCNTPGAVTLPNASPMGGAWMGPGISNNLFNPVTAGGVNTYTAIYTF